MKIFFSFLMIITLGVSITSCSAESNKNAEKRKKNNAKHLKDSSETTFNDASQKTYDTLSDYFQAYDRVLLEWGVPFEEIDLQTSHGIAHVIICGNQNDPPLVLLHGMNASSTMWYPNAKDLSENYCIYAIDYLMEPNKSKMKKKIRTPKEMCEWYDEVFIGLGLDHFSLGGISKGGWIATKYAVRFPEKIDHLVLLSPAQTFKWMSLSDDFVKSIMQSLNPNENSFDNIMKTMSKHPEKIIEPFKTQLQKSNEIATFRPITMVMVPVTRIELNKLDMPVLLMIGEDDLFNSPKSLEKAKKILVDVDTMTVKNSGHFISVDQSEIVNQKVVDFLQKKVVL